jgi:Lrp/AsnC family leucine-responsive transcriptional regulator
MKNLPLDLASLRILGELQKNSQISNAELADRIGISATPCWRRQKELEEGGYIERYAAIVDRRKVGLLVCCHAHISLNRHSAGVVEEFETTMQLRPEVVECYGTTGASDYIVKVIVADMDAYQAFLHDVLFKLQGIAQVNTTVALKEVKYQTALPLA